MVSRGVEQKRKHADKSVSRPPQWPLSRVSCNSFTSHHSVTFKWQHFLMRINKQFNLSHEGKSEQKNFLRKYKRRSALTLSMTRNVHLSVSSIVLQSKKKSVEREKKKERTWIRGKKENLKNVRKRSTSQRQGRARKWSRREAGEEECNET